MVTAKDLMCKAKAKADFFGLKDKAKDNDYGTCSKKRFGAKSLLWHMAHMQFSAASQQNVDVVHILRQLSHILNHCYLEYLL